MPPFTYHGICIGEDQIVHYGGKGADKLLKSGIRVVSEAEFRQGAPLYVRLYNCLRFDVNETAQRARWRLGEKRYDILFNNCEHFATWCAIGWHDSAQQHGPLQILDRFLKHWASRSMIFWPIGFECFIAPRLVMLAFQRLFTFRRLGECYFRLCCLRFPRLGS